MGSVYIPRSLCDWPLQCEWWFAVSWLSWKRIPLFLFVQRRMNLAGTVSLTCMFPFRNWRIFVHTHTGVYFFNTMRKISFSFVYGSQEAENATILRMSHHLLHRIPSGQRQKGQRSDTVVPTEAQVWFFSGEVIYQEWNTEKHFFALGTCFLRKMWITIWDRQEDHTLLVRLISVFNLCHQYLDASTCCH